ncbi:MAG: MFS transporter small subunit, partial [Bosea sp. (in: a-proteobacteria)]
IGPVVVNYIREAQVSAGVTGASLYSGTMYILAGMLAAGLVANALVRPLGPQWFMKEEEVAKLQAASRAAAARETTGSFGIGKGGFDATAALAWAVVGIPLAWGIWITLSKSLTLFK